MTSIDGDLVKLDRHLVEKKSKQVGTFPAAYRDLYTTWFSVRGRPAVQYMTKNLVWAQIVEQEDHGIKSYDLTWSGQPGEERTIYDCDEAVAFALWLIS